MAKESHTKKFAKKFQSKYLAFIDSDTYTGNNWLLSAIRLLKIKNLMLLVVQVFHLNQSYLEKISTMQKDPLCNWLFKL